VLEDDLTHARILGLERGKRATSSGYTLDHGASSLARTKPRFMISSASSLSKNPQQTTTRRSTRGCPRPAAVQEYKDDQVNVTKVVEWFGAATRGDAGKVWSSRSAQALCAHAEGADRAAT
jgi:hypothetical protein